MVARTPPVVDELTAPFWHGGADGRLLIQRCATCSRWHHPPVAICPACLGRELHPQEVSGRGTVHSFTINRHQSSPGLVPPYVLAEVELAEQPGLRLLASVVDCEIDDVAIGMEVTARFEAAGEAFVPVFAP